MDYRKFLSSFKTLQCPKQDHSLEYCIYYHTIVSQQNNEELEIIG